MGKAPSMAASSFLAPFAVVVWFALAEVLRPGERESKRRLACLPDVRRAVAVLRGKYLHPLKVRHALPMASELLQRPRVRDLEGVLLREPIEIVLRLFTHLPEVSGGLVIRYHVTSDPP